MPITVVRNDEQNYESKYNDMITNVIKENAKGSAGLPISIQVVGLPYSE